MHLIITSSQGFVRYVPREPGKRRQQPEGTTMATITNITADKFEENIMAVLAEHGDRFETIKEASMALQHYVGRLLREEVPISSGELHYAERNAFSVAELMFGRDDRMSRRRRTATRALEYLAYRHFRAHSLPQAVIDRLTAA